MRGRVLGALAVAAALAAGAVEIWVRTAPVPPLEAPLSRLVLDREGEILAAFPAADGAWRLPPPARVDPGYVAILLAYEDRRFFLHPGVDPLALARAAVQAVAAGRAVSGGSTLTMQVARLLTRAPTDAPGAKLAQIRLALALERRLSKAEILGLYLRLAPFGGPVEGVATASRMLFGKGPERLTPAEAALLVALPQAPNRRRPDRDPQAARAARDAVLARAARAGALDAQAAEAARREAVPAGLRPLPRRALHLAERLATATPGSAPIQTTLDSTLQARAEAALAEAVRGLDPETSGAVIVADARTGEIRARVGSPGFADARRRGFVDLSRAPRSPGSTLKPLIYGLAFEDGIAHPDTVIVDAPRRFGLYEPRNFDGGFRGPVRLREALQLSLNTPAVAVLDRVGPQRFVERLRRAGAAPTLPGGGAPGLAVALGGVGLTLEDMATLYAALARGGRSVRLTETPRDAPLEGPPLLDAKAAWLVGDALRGAPRPGLAPAGAIAFKTGTSYGRRDAWAIGYDGRHVVAVLIGRADNGAMPGALGAGTAAPAMFALFDALGATPPPPPPPDALTGGAASLPEPLRRFAEPRLDAGAPELLFPPDGATVAAPGGALAIRIRGGAAPFTVLVNQSPALEGLSRREAVAPVPARGFATVTVVDRDGRSARARVALAAE